DRPTGRLTSLMLSVIGFSTGHRCEPVAWSVGWCASCEREGAVRLEDVFRVGYLTVMLVPIPITRARVRQISLCDFCGRRVPDAEAPSIPLSGWTPRDGIAALYERLDLPIRATATRRITDRQLRSLLTSAESTAAAHRIALGPFGIGLGIVAGVL